MKNLFVLFLFLCSIPCLYAHKKESRGGVVFTFDDHFISNWMAADSVLRDKYQWRASFCVSRIGELKKDQIQKLKILQKRGHEITCHGYKHINALEFLKNHSYSQYFDLEIIPALSCFKKNGLNVQTFAYPFGRRDKALDSLLTTRFTVLRALTGTGRPAEKSECYWTAGPVVKAIGIDHHQRTSDFSYLESLLKYARDNDLIIVFFGHNIDRDKPIRHVTSYKKLEFICQYVKENKMHFYRLKDLCYIPLN